MSGRLPAREAWALFASAYLVLLVHVGPPLIGSGRFLRLARLVAQQGTVTEPVATTEERDNILPGTDDITVTRRWTLNTNPGLGRPLTPGIAARLGAGGCLSPPLAIATSPLAVSAADVVALACDPPGRRGPPSQRLESP